MTLGSIPSPSDGVLRLGPLSIHAYGACIALGVLAAIAMASRRWQRRGGNAEDIVKVATWAVPAGVIGARLYHVATDWRSYQGHWSDAVTKIGKGGLGIWGGVALGTIVGVWVGRRRGLSLATLMDVSAPAIPLAQAIGRWGNWWNQELFGRPTKLPWGLTIDPNNRPAGYADFSTFHPTFLYESLWNLVIVGVLLVVERRFRVRPGRLFALYVTLYTFGRFFIERVRIDNATHVGGLRINEIVSAVVFVVALGVLLIPSRKAKPLTGEAARASNAAPSAGGEAGPVSDRAVDPRKGGG